MHNKYKKLSNNYHGSNLIPLEYKSRKKKGVNSTTKILIIQARKCNLSFHPLLAIEK